MLKMCKKEITDIIHISNISVLTMYVKKMDFELMY